MTRLWTLPANLVGTLVAQLSSARYGEIHAGSVLIVRLPPRALLARLLVARGFQAITIGNVVLLAAMPTAGLLAHEIEHVRQWARWGPLFPIAYLLASLWSLSHGAGWHAGNAFERAAAREVQR